MKQKMIKVALVEPLQEPRMIEIENDYKVMQKIVGGLIQSVSEPITGFDVIIDDEGKFREQKLNRMWGERDCLVGTFFVSKADNEGNFVSLSDIDFHKVKKVFGLSSQDYPALLGTWKGI